MNNYIIVYLNKFMNQHALICDKEHGQKPVVLNLERAILLF